MSSTLGELKVKQNYALGTAETKFFTDEKRTYALNKACENILEQYDVPEYITTSALTFASGVCDTPTAYLRALKLFDTSSPTTEYERLDYNDFDNAFGNSYTIKDSSGTRKIFIYPTTITTGTTLRYLKGHTYMSADSDTTLFPVRWDDAIVTMSAYHLFYDSRNYDDAQAKKALADDLLAKVFQSTDRDEGILHNQVESYYSSRRMFTKNNW